MAERRPRQPPSSGTDVISREHPRAQRSPTAPRTGRQTLLLKVNEASRPPAMNAEQIRHARALLTPPENTVTSIAKLLGVSRTTLYKYVPELRVGRDALVSGDRGLALPGPR
ncbi:helix-turn-helix domain-containing protein [Streptomyces sp. NPDC059862]|uniref:helix-turn-helix domain-containing protein n=1 Tax=unclassified Streptomyces TaxID=2593676 RepID=UPI003643E641